MNIFKKAAEKTVLSVPMAAGNNPGIFAACKGKIIDKGPE